MRAAFCGVVLVLVLVLALGLGAPAAALAADPDLAGEWHLDSMAGGTTPDTSGHNETATDTGSPAAVPDGRFGQAVRFPAKTDVIDAGNLATLQPRNVSLLAWVRSSTVPSTVKTIVAQGAAGQCSHASYALYMGGSTQGRGPGCRFRIRPIRSTRDKGRTVRCNGVDRNAARRR